MGLYAVSKGYSRNLGFLLGLINWVGVIILFCLNDNDEQLSKWQINVVNQETESQNVKTNCSFFYLKFSIIIFAICLETDEKTRDVLEMGAFSTMD